MPLLQGLKERLFPKPAVAEFVSSTEKLRVASYAEASLASPKHPDHNEDRTFILPIRNGEISGFSLGVFDGVGGSKGGEIAARLSKDAAQQRLSILTKYPTQQEIELALTESIHTADQTIKDQSDGKSTACLGTFWKSKDGQTKLTIANVGDSRAYRLRNGQLECLTLDDNLLKNFIESKLGRKLTEQDFATFQQIQESVLGVNSPNEITVNKIASLMRSLGLRNIQDLQQQLEYSFQRRNIISNSIGGQSEARPTFRTIDVQSGDRIFFSSDGIHDNLTNQEIAKILAQTPNDQEAVQKLTQTAYQRANSSHPRAKMDDISVSLVTVDKEQSERQIQSQPQPLVQKALQANSLEELANEPTSSREILINLLATIDQAGSIQTSREAISAQNVRELIIKVLMGEEQPIILTRNKNLREIVSEVRQKLIPLFAEIDQAGIIQTSEGPMPAAEIKSRVIRVLMGEKPIILTRTNELRTKVCNL